MAILPSVIALFLASPIAMINLVTLQKYTRTYFLLTKSWLFYVYGFIYGFAAFFIVLVIPPSVFHLPNIWIEAGAVGISTKAFFNIVLISLPKSDGLRLDGDEPIHIGTQLVTTLFEAFIIPDIISNYEKRLNHFINERAQHYTSLTCVQEMILRSPPSYIEDDIAKSKGFKLDMNRPLVNDPSASEYVKVRRLMKVFLKFVGREYFNSVFTLRPESHINGCSCNGRARA